MLPQRAAVAEASAEADIGEDSEDTAEHAGSADPGGAVELTGRVSPLVVPVVQVPTRRQRRAARQLQARKVGRLVRRVDPFTMLRVAGLFYLCAFLMAILASVALWSLAVNAGVVTSVEDFVRQAYVGF